MCVFSRACLAINHTGNPGSVGGPAGAGYLTVKLGTLVKVRFPLGNLDLLCNFGYHRLVCDTCSEGKTQYSIAVQFQVTHLNNIKISDRIKLLNNQVLIGFNIYLEIGVSLSCHNYKSRPHSSFKHLPLTQLSSAPQLLTLCSRAY